MRPLRTLTTAREVHRLSREEAARAYPIHLRAVVTYYDPYIDSRHGALFLLDPTGGIFAAVPSLPILPLRPGALVDVVGVSGPGDYAPVVNRVQARILGNSHVPRNPPTVTMTQLLSGSLDSEWVEVEGVVRSVLLTNRSAVLTIETIGGSITATTLRASGQDYDALVDAQIRIHGNAGVVFNKKREMVGARLFFPSLDEVKVMQAPPADPFAMPARSIPRLLQFTPGEVIARRARVQGRVTLQWPGRMLCIQQVSDGLCLQTTQTTPVSAGELVDVIGFPATREYKPTMENASFRPVNGGIVPVTAKPVTSDQAFHGDHDGELVLIEGELIDHDRSADDLKLLLRSGKYLFTATLPGNSILPGMPSWKNGSLLRVTGICSAQIDPESTNLGEGEVRTASIRMLLRSAGDVQVLRTPSWWTGWHTLVVLGILLVVAFAFFAWIVVLRHQVERQTKALRDSEERLRHLSEHDALTNLPNRILLNDRLTMALQRADRFHAILGLLMVDADRFKDVNDVYGHPVGDKLLCELAKRISHSVRLTDTVARIGGDEFIVLLPDLHSRDEAQAIAAKIVAAISVPFQIVSGQAPLPVTVSVGVCTYPDAGLDMDDLLQHVDAAMYCVKAHGRNGFQVYRPNGYVVH
jgi:diguanylate cyclase (GGDEF)-like protein